MGEEAAWRRKIITWAVIGALWFTGLGLMLMGGSPMVQIFGFWIVVGGLIGCALHLVFAFARVVVGEAWPEFHGDREIAVALAFLIAFMLAPATVLDLGQGVSGLARGLIFEGPYLASTAPKNGKVASNLYGCVVDVRTCGYSAEKTKAGKAATNQAETEAEQPKPPSSVDSSWASFAIVLALALLAARGLRGARRDFFLRMNAQSRDAKPLTEAMDGQRPRFVSQVLMNYPTWVAFCIYALILIPATYLAVGSLLYLRLDSPSVDLATLTRDLDDAERQAMAAPGVSIETQRMRSDLDRLEPLILPRTTDDQDLALGRAAVQRGADYNTELTSGRPRYEKQALQYAAKYKTRATASQFEDYKAVQLARYESVIRDTRTKMRPCLEALDTAAKQIDLVQKARSASPAVTVAAAPGAAPTAQPPAATGLDSQVANLRLRLEEANQICLSTPPIVFPEAARPMDMQNECGEPADEAKPCPGKVRPQFPESMYQWLAASSEATVLIIGLVGFGLFGSAIRMMGRVDTPNVSDSAVQTARDKAYQARQDAAAPEGAYKAARAQLENQRIVTQNILALLEKSSNDATANAQAIVTAEIKLREAQATLATATTEHAGARTTADALTTDYDAKPESDRTPELAAELEAAKAKVAEAAKTLEVAQTAATEAAATLEALGAAKADLDLALSDGRTALANAQAEDKALLQEAQTAEAIWKAAEEAVVTAESYHQQLRSALVSDRTNIVVRRERTGGGTEFTISGAPAKVLVQGLGAAFTTFLAGQTGVHILTAGGRTNAYSLLLSCFVGAVFAEEIWRWARRYLPSDTTTTPQTPSTPPSQ